MRPTPRWSLRRTTLSVTLLATVTAAWLGFTAPTVSPVTPSAPVVVVAQPPAVP